jgi:S-DNA-T family DNA segregation ATPase FtsK/SpoIIIE
MGAQLHFLDELPHVTVCPAVRPDLVGLAVREADHACLARAELMRRHDANSIGDLRARSHLLNAQQGDLASIVLIINGWFTFAEDYPEEASSVTRLAADGSQFGVHVVIGSHRWADLRGALAENVARRLELRLPDPGQSMSWRAEQIRIENSPTGRGIAGKGLWFQTAAARWGADDRNAARLIEKVADKWVDRPRPMPLHILPERLDAGELPDDLGSITIGSTEGRAEAAWLDVFGREPHLLIFGDGNCGKTNALALVTQRMTRASARPVEVWVVDPDQRHDLMSLIGRVPASHRAILKSSIADLVGELAVELEGREALAAAAWEEKTEAAYPSEILLLVDDHHLIQVGANGPLAALSHFAAMRNLGFHIALARRANGAARVTTDPFIARLVEAGTPMLLMNGPASEPPISGSVRFRPQPVGRGMLVRSDNVWGIVQTATGVSLSAARRPATRRQSTRRKAD